MALKFYSSLAKGLKLKVRAFQGLILTFVESTGEKLAGGLFVTLILNRFNESNPRKINFNIIITTMFKLTKNSQKKMTPLEFKKLVYDCKFSIYCKISSYCNLVYSMYDFDFPQLTTPLSHSFKSATLKLLIVSK